MRNGRTRWRIAATIAVTSFCNWPLADDELLPEPTRQELLSPEWIGSTLGEIGIDRLIKLYDGADDAALHQLRAALELSRSFLSEHPEELRSQLQARLLTSGEAELAVFQQLPADRVRARAMRPSLIQVGDALLRRIPSPDQGGPLVASPDGSLFALGGARTKAAPPFERIQGVEVRSGVTGDLLRFIALEDGRCISPVGVSPDCEKLFGLTEDGLIRAWDLDTGEQVWSVLGGSVDLPRTSCDYSSDSALVAISPYRSHVVVLDVELGERVAWLEVDGNERIGEIAFLNDETLIGSCFDGVLRHWSIADEEVIAEFEINATCFSPDGTRAIEFVDKGKGLPDEYSGFKIIDTTSGEEIDFVEFEEPMQVDSEAIDTTGEGLLLCISNPGSRLLKYEISSGELTVDLDLRGELFNDFASQSGNRIVHGGYGSEIGLWDLNRPRIPSMLELASQSTDIEITADGATAMTMHQDAIRLWDTDTWQEKAVFTLPGICYRAAMSGDSQRIVFAMNNEIHALDVATGQTTELLKTSDVDDWIKEMELSGDGQVAAFTLPRQNKTYVIDANDGTLFESTDESHSVSLSYDGLRILLDRRLLDRDAGTEHEFEQVYGSRNAISADGRLGMIYNGLSGGIVWDLENGEVLKGAAREADDELLMISGNSAVAISGNGRFSVSCDRDSNVYLYDIVDRRQLAVVSTDASRITALELSEDGADLLIATRGGNWHHWKFENMPP
jgi:WD40 repeat protein